MDSSTKACESGKRNKFKFNPSTYKLARRKHTVMLSRISKMGVFGIVALMLAFGLVMTDAKAATDPSPVTVVVATGVDEAPLRATGEATLTFTINLKAVTDAAPSGTVTISTPRTWTSPRFMTSRTAARGNAPLVVAGDVTYQIDDGNTPADGAEDTDLISVDVANYQLKATVLPGAGADAAATITWRFRSALPNVAKDYSFGISSNVHIGTLTTLEPLTRVASVDVPGTYTFPEGAIRGTINEQKTYDGRGRYIVVDVGPVPDGTGKIELTRPSFTKGADDYISDPLVVGAGEAGEYNYAGQYLIPSGLPLGDLVFTFTPAGTMFKGSTVTLTLPSQDGNTADGDPTWASVMVDLDVVNQLREENTDNVRDRGEVTVRGAKLLAITGASSTSVTAITTKRIEAAKDKIVFTIGGAQAPAVTVAPNSPTAQRYTFGAKSGSALTPVDPPADPNEATTGIDLTGADGKVTFVVTNPHGTGMVVAGLTNVNSGAVADDMTLTFTAAGAMLEGSVVEIKVPAAWSPSPFKRTVTGGVERPGQIAMTAGEHTFEVANRVIKVTLISALDAAGVFTLTYTGAKPPDMEGEYEFSSMANSHKQGPLGAIASPMINVIVGDGSGNIELTSSNGARLDRATNAEVLGTVRFTYDPAGRMAIGSIVQITIPSGWTPPLPDNRDGKHDVGEVSLSGSADLVIVAPAPPGVDWTLTATTNAVITASNPLTIDYRDITAPAVDSGSYEFTTRVISPPRVNALANAVALALRAALLDPSPTVGINQAPDGSGDISWDVESPLVAGTNIGNVVITYTATGEMKIGSQVEIKIDAGWPEAIYDTGDGTPAEGETTVSGSGSPSLEIFGGNTLVATISSSVASGETITFTYKNINAPARGGPYTFSARSKVSTDGELRALRETLTVNVNQVAAGSIILTSSEGEAVESAAPGTVLGDLTFTYTAGASMATGAQVSILIPDGWTPPFRGNNAADSRAGAIWATGATLAISPGTEDAGPWTVTATTTGFLDSGSTSALTFTYRGVSAPGAGVYPFTTMSSTATGGTLLPIESSPIVIVRAPVTGIAIAADPTSVFTDEEVTLDITLLSGTEPGKALGDVVVMLSSTSETGSITDADGNAITSVTIADNTNGAMATFSDPTAGIVTITAMSGEMTETVDVEVKSTISNFRVNGMSDPDPVVAGTSITVSAIGQDGKATVKVIKKETDADGNEIVSSVVSTKSLDEDPDAADVSEGSVAYTRDIELTDLADGDYTVIVTIAGESSEIDIEVVAAREAVAELTLDASADSFFVGGSVTVTVALDARAPVGGLEVTLSTDPADSGMFSMTEGGEAISTVTVEDSADSMSAMVYYTNDTQGTVTLKATAGDDLEVSADVEVMSTISNLQVNGMDEPDSVAAGGTITVSATGKEGGATVSITDSEGEAVGSLTGLGLDADSDADVPEGNVAYSRDITLPDDLADGNYTVTVDIGEESSSSEFEVMAPRAPVTAIAIEADPTSVFAGDDIDVTVTLWDADGEGEASAAMVINLSDGDAGGSFTDADGNAITSITIPDGGFDASATYSNASTGEVTLTAMAADEALDLDPANVEVTVKSLIRNLQVNGMDEPGPFAGNTTITVSATGKDGRAMVSIN